MFVASGFEPRFYSGGPISSYLPLLHDLVTAEKPRVVVTVGLGDGEAHLAFCQTATEERLETGCVAFRRPTAGELQSDDPAWNMACTLTAAHRPRDRWR